MSEVKRPKPQDFMILGMMTIFMIILSPFLLLGYITHKITKGGLWRYINE